MKTKQYICVFLSVAFIISADTMPNSNAFAQSVDDLQLMTELFPPLNFEQDGKLQGITVDIMERMLRKLNSTLTRTDIRLLPWARAYKYAQTKENTCLFAMMRTEAREDLFKWVGPFIPLKIVLLAPKYKQIEIDTFHDLKKYRIGTVIDDIGEQLLVQQGFEKTSLIAVSDPILSVKQLVKGRIDLWAYGELTAKWLLKQEGVALDQYETVYVLSDIGKAYFAFHKDTSDALIEQFQQAFDELKAGGGVQTIIDNYLKE